MGASVSTTAVNSLSQTISNIASSTVQSCQVASDQSQTVNEVNTGWSLWSTTKLQQSSDISSQCFNDINKQTQLQDSIINAISQATAANGVGILGAFGYSVGTATANLSNIVRNNITMSNIQQSYNAIKQQQTVNYTNSGIVGFKTIELTQGAQLFAAATLNEVDKAGIFNTISSHLDQTSSASVSNPISDILNGLTSTVMMWIGLIILIIVSIIWGIPMISNYVNKNSASTNEAIGNVAGVASTLSTLKSIKK